MKTVLYLGLEPPSPKKDEQLILYPVLHIVPRPHSSPDIAHVLHSLAAYHTILFTSKTAVDLFFTLNLDRNVLHNMNWIAVGTATTKRLNEKGINTVMTATDETAEGVVALIDSLCFPPHTRLLWPHSAQARRIIPNALASRHLSLTECILYDTQLQTPLPKPDLTTIDEIFFTSPSTIDGFLVAYQTLPKDKTLRTIGPVTAAALKDLADIRLDKDTHI